jgi:anti-sigma factor RsiW
MDCRTFKTNHLAFLDDTLEERGLVAMQRHLAECGACARHDAAVRRGLMVLHNLPPIEPSPDFRARLSARLREERIAIEREKILARRTDTLIRAPRVGALAAAAASVLLAGTLAVGASVWNAGARGVDVVLPPVLAVAPLADTLPFGDAPTPPEVAPSVLLAAASSGMPVWPAAFLLDETPMQLLTAELRTVSDNTR